jgi:hypothetical protein
MANKKSQKNNEPVNITITPGTMDAVAKGDYESVNSFCDKMEEMGLGRLLSMDGKTDGIKELREYNDQKMKKYDPAYLEKREAERKTKLQPKPDQPTKPKDRFSDIELM